MDAKRRPLRQKEDPWWRQALKHEHAAWGQLVLMAPDCAKPDEL